MLARLPKSVKLTLISMVMLVAFGIGYNVQEAGVQLHPALELLTAVCALLWLPVLLWAIMQKRRQK